MKHFLETLTQHAFFPKSSGTKKEQEISTENRFFLFLNKQKTKENCDVTSIEKQKDYWMQRARSEGFQVVGIYEEKEYPINTKLRIDFRRMCNDIMLGNICGVLCWNLNQLTDNSVDTGYLQNLFGVGKLKQIKTSVHTYQLGSSWEIFNTQTGMVDDYKGHIKKMANHGLRYEVIPGLLPSTAPLGYKYDRVSKIIIPDQKSFYIIREAWRLLLTGKYSPKEILNILTGEGSRRYIKRDLFGKRTLTLRALHTMFRNPFYYGYSQYGGELYRGKQMPMITWYQFQEAQKILSGNND